MYQYKAMLERVVDGDTVRLSVDLGFSTWIRGESFRLAHIDAPEMSTLEGKLAKQFLVMQIPQFVTGGLVTLNCLGKDKYGRWLAEITMSDGTKLHELMIAAGHAKPYEGGKRA